MTLTEALLFAETAAFFEEFSPAFATPSQRESFARYGIGLMSELDRKSVEPIAALYCEKVEGRCSGMHQSLHRFIAEIAWDDHVVRAKASDYAIARMRSQAALEVAILDDTSFVKSRSKSVGTARQYCGRLGKIENCQVAVGLAVANGIDAVTVDMELYLPHSWTSDPVQRALGKIPHDIEFRTKPQLGIMLLMEAAKRGIKPGVVVADSDYGKDPMLREGIRDLDMHFAVGVHCDQPVRLLDRAGQAIGDIMTATAIAHALPSDDFREVIWRQGSDGPLKGRFAIVPVIAAEQSDVPISHTDREALSLLVEWEEGAEKPEHFTLISFDVAPMTLEDVVRIVKERWRIERCFQEMKSELGLDHFEGRSWQGWNHHASMVIVCHAFTLSVRAKVSPPGDPPCEAAPGALAAATAATRRELFRDASTRHRAMPASVAAAGRAA